MIIVAIPVQSADPGRVSRSVSRGWTYRPDVLATGRLCFHKWELKDRVFYRRLCAEPEVMAYLEGPQTAHDADEEFEYLSTRCPTFFALSTAHDGCLLGFCGVLQLEEWESQSLAGEFEIGWRLVKAAWGKGYASEAAAAILARFYSDMTVFPSRRVVSRVDPENVRSVAVLKRLGMRLAPDLAGPEEQACGLSVYIADRKTFLDCFRSLSRRGAPLDSAAAWGWRTALEVREAIHLEILRQVRSLRPIGPAIEKYFQISSANHFLRANDLDWLELQEPQVTRAWKHFLSEGAPATRRARLIAFRAALYLGAAPPFAWHHAEVCAEKPVSAGSLGTLRIDLAIRHDCEGSPPRRWTVVEAKFGHSLTNDLRAYEGGIREGDTEFFILGVNRDPSMESNPKWTFVGWRAFLQSFEQMIDPAHDSVIFRAFRRSNFIKASAHVR